MEPIKKESRAAGVELVHLGPGRELVAGDQPAQKSRHGGHPVVMAEPEAALELTRTTNFEFRFPMLHDIII